MSTLAARAYLTVVFLAPLFGGLLGAQAPLDLVRDADAARRADVRARYGPRFDAVVTDRFEVFGDTSPRARRVAAACVEATARELRKKFFRADPRAMLVVLAENDDSLDVMAAGPPRPETDEEDGEAAPAPPVPAPDTRPVALTILRRKGRRSATTVEPAYAELVARRLLDDELPRQPEWIRESLALVFTPASLDDGRLVLGDAPPTADEALAYFRSGVLDKTTLDAARAESKERMRFRAEKLATELARYLLVSDEGKLAGLVARLRAGATFDAAFRAASGLTADALKASLARHFEERVATMVELRGLKSERQLAVFAKFRPDFGPGRFAHAKALAAAKVAEESVTCFRAALADPRFSSRYEAYVGLAGVLYDEEAHDEEGRDAADAAKAYEHAVRLMRWRLDVDATVYERLALVRRVQKDREGSKAALAALAAERAADVRPE
jgi:hypothetical protein